MISRENIIWLAGYLEGEGCFTISTSLSRSGSKAYRILVNSEDKDVIEKASCILHGYPRLTSSKPRNHNKTFYGTNINGNNAIGWMMTLYTLMSIRRKKRIREVVEDWKNNIREYSMTKKAIKSRRDRANIIKKSHEFKQIVNPFLKKEKA